MRLPPTKYLNIFFPPPNTSCTPVSKLSEIGCFHPCPNLWKTLHRTLVAMKLSCYLHKNAYAQVCTRSIQNLETLLSMTNEADPLSIWGLTDAAGSSCPVACEPSQDRLKIKHAMLSDEMPAIANTLPPHESRTPSDQHQTWTHVSCCTYSPGKNTTASNIPGHAMHDLQ